MTKAQRARIKKTEEKLDTILKLIAEKPYTLAIVLPVVALATYGFIKLVF